jgi:hypothetical protein
MKQRTLRTWHRKIGMIIALFVFLQSGSGLLITLFEFSPHDSQAHEDILDEKQDSSIHEHKGEFFFERGLAFMHHGDPAFLGLYRIFLGAAIIVQTVLGAAIFLKMKALSRKQEV